MGDFNYSKRRLGKVLAPLNKKLKSVEWGEFRVGDLFEVKSAVSFDEGKLKLREYNENGLVEFVGRTKINNGVKGYVNKMQVLPNPKDSISISQIGTIVAQLRKNDWYASQNIFILTSKYKRLISLYTVSIINKALNIFSGGYSNYPTLKKLNSLLIKLPTKNNKIDFEFMEEFIKEIEKAKLKKIKDYLKENNLEDTNLTDKEKEALERFEKNQIEWKEFKIEDLFNVKSSKRKFDSNKITILDSGRPYVVRMSSNNGIKGYLKEDEKFLNDGNTISFGQDTATVFYQKEPYFTGDKIKILQLKEFDLSKFKGLFFVTTIRKSFSCFQWGGTSFSEKVIKNQQIFLPIKNNKIDFEFMENLISALEKNLIKKILNAFKGKI